MQERTNPRRAALEVLIRLEKQHSNSALLLQEILRDISDPSDRNLITDLVLGTLRWRGRLRFLIESFSKRALSRLDKNVVLLLQLGLYQLLYTGIPQHAAIYETAELCKKMKLSSATSFVNGILRTAQKQISQLPEPSRSELSQYLSVNCSHPEWLVKRWLDRFGVEETTALMEINNQPAPIYLRMNELVSRASDSITRLKQEGIDVRETEFGPGVLRVMKGASQQTKTFSSGEFYIQDAGVEIIGKTIDPQPGCEILEVAAAPGGKTFQLAIRMGDKGRIVSIDSDKNRMKRWMENISRLKIHCAVPVVADARALPFRTDFDAVVIDAPCSSLGILRRHPEIKWWRTQDDLSVFRELQLQIMNECARFVRKQGLLFYSVCSFEPEETSQVSESFLNSNSQFEQIQSSTLYPHRNDTDGFYLAGFRRS